MRAGLPAPRRHSSRSEGAGFPLTPDPPPTALNLGANLGPHSSARPALPPESRRAVAPPSFDGMPFDPGHRPLSHVRDGAGAPVGIWSPIRANSARSRAATGCSVAKRVISFGRPTRSALDVACSKCGHSVSDHIETKSGDHEILQCHSTGCGCVEIRSLHAHWFRPSSG